METEGKWNETAGSSFEGEHGIKDKARNTREKARSQVRSFADSSRTQLAHQISGVGRALRSAGDQLRSEESGEKASQYSEMLADRMDRASRFLDEHDADELIGEVENYVKRNPLVFIGGCLAIGFAVGRFLKANPGEDDSGRFSQQEHMPLGVSGPSYESTPRIPDPGPVVSTEVPDITSSSPQYTSTPTDNSESEER